MTATPRLKITPALFQRNCPAVMVIDRFMSPISQISSNNTYPYIPAILGSSLISALRALVTPVFLATWFLWRDPLNFASHLCFVRLFWISSVIHFSQLVQESKGIGYPATKGRPDGRRNVGVPLVGPCNTGAAERPLSGNHQGCPYDSCRQDGGATKHSALRRLNTARLSRAPPSVFINIARLTYVLYFPALTPPTPLEPHKLF